MNIINSHVHFNTTNDFFFYSDYTIERLISEMKNNGVDFALPCLNPKIGILRCPNDCSYSCKYSNSTPNNNLQNCNCKTPLRHRVKVSSIGNQYSLICKTCEKHVFTLPVDPLRKYNIDLISECSRYSNMLKPLLYISLCESTIQKEIDFFEKNFYGKYAGYKLHPWTDQVSVKDFKINTKLPILIHTGLREFELADDAVTFASKNPNTKVVIAHAAQLKTQLLRQINIMDNVYIDCCPANFLYQNKDSCFANYSNILSPEDIFYEVLRYLHFSKILFGTDSPWGNTKDEILIVNSLNISRKIKKSIFSKNAQHVYDL